MTNYQDIKKPFLTYFLNNTITCIILIFSFSLSSIAQITSYDDLPGIDPIYKPAYSDNYPDWAKKMYESDVNYYEIKNLFETDNSAYKIKSPILRYYKIWSRGVIDFVQSDGRIELPDPSTFDAHFPISTVTAAKSSTWELVGPIETYWLNSSGSATPPSACSWQANVYAFDIAPSNSSVLYAGTETGFVNKTIDEGLNWTLVGQNYNFGGAINAVAIHPDDENTVLVGAAGLIHQSIDGGLTWNSIFDHTNSISKIIIDPSDPLHILCAGSSGIDVTLDGGGSWSSTHHEVTWDVEFNPLNSDSVYALTKQASNYEFLLSSDGGITFSLLNSFPLYVESSGGLIAVSDDEPNSAFAGLLTDNGPELIKGTFSGSWSFATIASGNTSALPMNNGQGFFDLILEVNPTTSDEIFFGTTTLYKSTNAGANFRAIGGYEGSFPIHPDIQWIKFVDALKMWVATDGGMNYSTDAFTNVNNYSARNNGLVGSDMWGFDQGWNEDICVGGRYHNGNTAITDFYGPKALRMGGAESPTGWVIKGESRHVTFNDLGQGWIIPPTAELQHEGRFNYSEYPNMDEYGGRRSNLIHHPNYYGKLYIGQANSFWESNDKGESYDMLHTFPDRILYVEVSLKNPEVFYADILNHGLYKSEDGGLTWTSKPSLTTSYASSLWEGKTFFVISSFNENTIYACLQNGTWSNDIGSIFRSTDGGDTWSNWTGSLNVRTKNMAIQPAIGNKDIVYITANRGGPGDPAQVFYRYSDDADWTELGNDFPAGFSHNLILPFYRDSKLRVSGNGGVWERDLLESEYPPLINPWVETYNSGCMDDTLQFDDHSVIDHSGVTWNWSITPAPTYVDNPNVRNPKVVLGALGSYDVSLVVTKNGTDYIKTIPNMVVGSECPSLDNCNNPAIIPKSAWSVIDFDSEERNAPGLARMLIDDDFSTLWHTSWTTGTDLYPHHVTIDLDENYLIKKFIYYPRTDGENGRIADYELYIDDNMDPSTQVSSGVWTNSATFKEIDLSGTGVYGRYLKLNALSEVNAGPWASGAEIELVGCYSGVTAIQEKQEIDMKAYPVPVIDDLTIDIGMYGNYSIRIFGTLGQEVLKLNDVQIDQTLQLNMHDLVNGQYIIELRSKTGKKYRIKVIK